MREDLSNPLDEPQPAGPGPSGLGAVRWRLIAAAVLAAFVLSFTGVAAIISGYAFYLAIWFGEVDGTAIEAFSRPVGEVGGRLLSILLVFPAGIWAGRRARAEPLLHGALVGAGAALVGLGIDVLFGERIELVETASALGNLGLGMLGGLVARAFARTEERIQIASRDIEHATLLDDLVAAVGRAFVDRGVDFVGLREPGPVWLATWSARSEGSSRPEDSRSEPPALLLSLDPLRSRHAHHRVLEVACTRGSLSRGDARRIRSLAPQLRLALENLRLLERARAAGVLEERRRLAHQIHDTLAQGFASIVLHLEAAEPAFPDTAAAVRGHLDQARSTARESLARAREIVWALRPDTEERLPLGDAIRHMTEGFAAETGTETRIEVTGEARRLRPEVEAAVTRAAQEAIANVRKHAGAKRLAVTLSYMDDVLMLDVRDDGCGFDSGGKREGYGLDSLREGIKKVGGSLAVESIPGEGTTVVVEVPALPFDPMGER